MVPVTAQSYSTRLGAALPAVRERIGRAAEAAGRPPDAVRLVAVTKAHPIEAVEAALGAGLTDLGENRIAELEDKFDTIGGEGVTWHMIGHLQSRKARRAAEIADVIHSVDTVRLAEKLARAARELSRTVVVLAQVNTTGEEAKSGFALDGAVERILEVAELPGLELAGLMTMAPFVADESVQTTAFGRLRTVSEKVRAVSDRIGPELSMGMTNDLDVAVREGSTMVRIGTALFGERAR